MATTKELSQSMLFINSGLSGMLSVSVIQPMDLIKTRMQISGEGGKRVLYKNSFHALGSIVKDEGVLHLYKGLSAALLRQATYTTARLGIFQVLIHKANDHYGPDGLGLFKRMFIGAFAGGIGSIVGTPADVALIRMTADGALPLNKRRKYKNVFHAIYKIVGSEGPTALFKGVVPTIIRACLLSASQLGGYNQLKSELVKRNWKNDLKLHVVASLGAAVFCSVVSLPADILKTRLQQMTHNQYKSVFDCLTKLIQQEGILALWKGFVPYFLRLGPHTVLTLVFMEFLNSKTLKFVNK